MFEKICHFNYGQDSIHQAVMYPADAVKKAEQIFKEKGASSISLSFSDQHISYNFDGVWKLRGEPFVWWWE